MSTDVHKRLGLLSTYIQDLAQNVKTNNISNAATIVKENKSKIDNNDIIKFAFESQIINSLSESNRQLKEQLSALRDRKQKLESEKESGKYAKVGY